MGEERGERGEGRRSRGERTRKIVA